MRRFHWVVSIVIVLAAGLAWWLRPVPPEVTATAHLAAAPPLAEHRAPGSQSATSLGHAPNALPAAPAPVSDRPTANAAQTRHIDEQQRLQVEQDFERWYEDVGAELGLSEDEKFALIRSITEHHIQLMELPYDGGVGAVERARELRQAQREDLLSLLGSKRLAALDQYQRSLGARIEVQELMRFQAMTRANPPISAQQRRRLVRAAIDAGAYFDDPVFTGADSPDAMMQEQLAKMEQRDAKLLDAARRVLGAEYLEGIQVFQDGRRNAYQQNLSDNGKRPAARE